MPKRDVLRAVLADQRLSEAERQRLAAVGRRIALLFHVEFHARRERLRDLYARLDPAAPGEGPIEAPAGDREAFFAALDAALRAANFRALDETGLAEARDARGRVSARVHVPKAVFERARFYVRGRRRRTIDVPRFMGLFPRPVETDTFANVVLVVSPAPQAADRRRELGRLRPGAVYIKLFRDIPVADLETLYPNARVVMGLLDKLVLGVPAVVGGVPILLNIVPALSVLLLVIGFYLGITGSVEGDAVKQALAALSGLGALGGFLMRQWVKYERQKLRYQKQVAENAYFNNVNNNAGFFDHLIGASEDSEVKEAFLAYSSLLLDGPAGEAALDARVEGWLRERLGVTADFEIDDALAKLRRFGLVDEGADGALSAVDLPTALGRLDTAWAETTETAFAVER